MLEKISSLIFLISFSAMGDFGQGLPGQMPDHLQKQETVKGAGEFFMDSSEDILKLQEKMEASNIFHGAGKTLMDQELSEKEKLRDFDQIIFEERKGDSYLKMDDATLFKKISREGSSSFGLRYFADTYTYRSQNNIFERTFVEGESSFKGGYLSFFSRKRFAKSFFNLFWGTHLGVGFAEGKGLFIDGRESDAIFHFWTVPFEVFGGLQFPVSPYLRLGVRGGPSFVGVLQNRSDTDREDPRRRRGQFGYGAFLEGTFAINLGSLMKRQAIRLFHEAKVTGLYLETAFRLQSYSKFRNRSFAISGASFGLGLCFDYL